MGVFLRVRAGLFLRVRVGVVLIGMGLVLITNLADGSTLADDVNHLQVVPVSLPLHVQDGGPLVSVLDIDGCEWSAFDGLPLLHGSGSSYPAGVPAPSVPWGAISTVEGSKGLDLGGVFSMRVIESAAVGRPLVSRAVEEGQIDYFGFAAPGRAVGGAALSVPASYLLQHSNIFNDT